MGLTRDALELLHRRVWTDGLVLSVDEDPESEVGDGNLHRLSDSSLEGLVRLGLKHSISWEIGRRDVLVLEAGEIEALVLLEGGVGDELQAEGGARQRIVSLLSPKSVSREELRDQERGETHLGSQVQMLLLLLPLLRIQLLFLILEPFPQMTRSVSLGERLEHLLGRALPDVDEHVGVGEALRRPRRIPREVGRRRADDLASVVVLEDLLVGDRRDAVVVVLEPLSVLLRLDEGKVVTAVEVAGMDEDTVELVLVVLGEVGSFVEVLGQVDLEGVLVSVVNLRNAIAQEKVSYVSYAKERKAKGEGYLDERVSLEVVLEPLELEVQDWRESLEDDTLPRVLETELIAGLVPVLAVHGLNGDIVPERLGDVLHSLDVKLDICDGRKVSNQL
jgi:hypothetical protein